jgi:hypothetical protein
LVDHHRINDSNDFDEELADEVLRTNDETLFLVALRRDDCPAGLLIDLSQAPSTDVRKAVAVHANTPVVTLRRLAKDKDEVASRTASARLA